MNPSSLNLSIRMNKILQIFFNIEELSFFFKDVLGECLGKANTLAGGVLLTETKPRNTERKYTLRELPKQNESTRHVHLGFVSAYLKRQWLHLSACVDPLLSLCRQRIRTASCRSAWSW